MQITYESSIYCEFTILALIKQWQELGSISAYEIAIKNNIPMNVWWSFYNSYQAVKKVGK